MIVQRFTTPSMGENCYLVMNEKTKEMLLIDPGMVLRPMEKFLEDYPDYTMKAILLTHGHGDHIMGVPYYRKKFKVPVYAHQLERELLENPRHNLSAMMGESCILEDVHYFEDGEVLSLAGFDIHCIHTPGHSPGGSCFQIEEELFTGDTLFKMGIGRYDLYGSDGTALFQSIAKILALPDMTIRPGHGVPSTIAYEKKHNPFVREL